MTNSSSASFVIATNLEPVDMLEYIWNSEMENSNKFEIKKLLTDHSKQLPPREMSSAVLKQLEWLIPLDDDDVDYMMHYWLDEAAGRVRYKNIFVFKAEQWSNEWAALFEFLEKFREDKTIFVTHFYWD